MGALWAVVQDTGPSYWIRARRIVVAGLSSAAGLALGQAAVRTHTVWAVAVCVTVVAAAAGIINYSGTLGSVAGMHSLLGAIVGSGFILQGPFWLPPVELLLGTVLVLAFLGAAWLPKRHSAELTATARVFDAALTVLIAAGTDRVTGARRELTQALDGAQRMMGRYRPRTGTDLYRGTHAQQIMYAFQVAHDCAEIATALAWEANILPAQLIIASAELPMELGLPAVPSAAHADPLTDRPQQGRDTAATRALQDLLSANRRLAAGSFQGTPLSGSVVGWGTRIASAAVLASCMLAAVVIAALMEGPRAYWLPLGVAFIYKPELAPVPNRALQRCIGTAVGVGIAGFAAATKFSTYPAIGLVVVCGALLAIGVVAHYIVATMALTAIVFVFVDFLGDHSDLLLTRFLDTAIAAGIVVLAHVLVPKQAWATRATVLLTDAQNATERYAREAQLAQRTEQTALRRRAYSLLAEARVAITHARREWWSRRDWTKAEATIRALEERCDAVTADIVAARRR
ncbi:MAG: FUSC family protein [Mycobacterium sp.]